MKADNEFRVWKLNGLMPPGLILYGEIPIVGRFLMPDSGTCEYEKKIGKNIL